MNEILVRVGRIERIQEQLVKTQHEMIDEARKFQVESKKHMSKLMSMMITVLHGEKSLEDHIMQENIKTSSENMNVSGAANAMTTSGQEPIRERYNPSQLQKSSTILKNMTETMHGKEKVEGETANTKVEPDSKKRGMEEVQIPVKKAKNNRKKKKRIPLILIPISYSDLFPFLFESGLLTPIPLMPNTYLHPDWQGLLYFENGKPKLPESSKLVDEGRSPNRCLSHGASKRLNHQNEHLNDQSQSLQYGHNNGKGKVRSKEFLYNKLYPRLLQAQLLAQRLAKPLLPLIQVGIMRKFIENIMLEPKDTLSRIAATSSDKSEIFWLMEL
ncbi:hypothetical protein F3Y22_tig00110126pilonHSYRG00074 [Hibiscus syriacus]|uniref:Uncharacterized protein n=1 Tax=Hibiscus syriacus TaxID=106335 RepID=A0A6A3BJ50_HIBSY|nr:hypothetical protein F3Y22_tig00110126pilonHSYRG00074 [Hibiscus syriacus]